MRIALLLVLAGCSPTDTTLTNGNDDDNIASGTGRMTIDKAEILIQDIPSGYSKGEQFTITSTGDANLLIYEIRIVADASDVFYFDEVEDVTLATDQTVSETVVAELPVGAVEPFEGQLRIRTNDPDNAALIVPLVAWPEGYVPPEDTGGGDTGGDTGADTGDDTTAR